MQKVMFLPNFFCHLCYSFTIYAHKARAQSPIMMVNIKPFSDKDSTISDAQLVKRYGYLTTKLKNPNMEIECSMQAFLSLANIH